MTLTWLDYLIFAGVAALCILLAQGLLFDDGKNGDDWTSTA